jgi:hypothetical protein
MGKGSSNLVNEKLTRARGRIVDFLQADECLDDLVSDVTRSSMAVTMRDT